MRETDEGDESFAKKRRRAMFGVIVKLIGQHELSRRVLFLERSNGRERQGALDTQRLHPVNVGTIIELGRREAMAASVTRQKRHARSAERADEIAVRRRAPRRGNCFFLCARESFQCVQPATADHSDHSSSTNSSNTPPADFGCTNT